MFYSSFALLIITRGWFLLSGVISTGVVAIRRVRFDTLGTPTQAAEGGDTSNRDNWHLLTLFQAGIIPGCG